MKGKKTIPRFTDEDTERAFWSRHDSTPYVDWRSGRRVLFSAITRKLSLADRIEQELSPPRASRH